MPPVNGYRFVVLLLILYLVTTAFFLLFIQHTSVRGASGGDAAAARSPLLLRQAQMRRHQQQQTQQHRQEHESAGSRRVRDRPLVLFWTPLWDSFDTWSRFFSVPRLGECRQRCAFSDQEQYLEQAALVVFSAVDVHRMPPPPADTRPAGQLWALLALDPPIAAHRALRLHQYDRIFNWTLSYRQDADVPLQYGIVEKLKRPLARAVAPAAPTQRRALFRPQLCLTESRREQYVHLLQKHMPVDVFGPCATTDCGAYRPCFKHRHDPGLARNLSACEPAAECLSQLSMTSDYSFYLALEPVHCRDFVSARLHQALRSRLIPVVRGGADYARLTPPGSYIDADQFSSPEALAHYLTSMSERQLADFRRWWRTHRVKPASWACQLCRRLHAQLLSKDGAPAYGGDQLHSWWNQKPGCDRPVTASPPPTAVESHR